MAWTYSNWVTQTTAAAQLAALNLHIQEVSDKVGNELGADGKNISSDALERRLAKLMDQRAELMAAIGGVNGGTSLADMTRADR